MSKLAAVVPFSRDYEGDRLFKEGGPLDRDGSLKPWSMLRGRLADRGIRATTIDLVGSSIPDAWIHLDCHRALPSSARLDRTVLVLTEPEVVAPLFYRGLEADSAPCAVVFTHRLDLVEHHNDPAFRYLRWPQPVARHDVFGPRDVELVMINARKHPVKRRNALYGRREQVAAWFARRNRIDVYGPGWGKVEPRHPISTFRNLQLRKAHRGVLHRKSDVLLRAQFVLCFENMVSPGYRTEKIFDALASGSIPIYWGDPRIKELVPGEAFIDYGAIRSPRELAKTLRGLPPEARTSMREIGQHFLDSDSFRSYSPDAFATEVADTVAGLLE